MKKLFVAPAIFLIILFNTSTVHSSPSLSDKDLVSICNEVYDALMINQAAVEGKSYIVINVNSKPLNNLSESSKQQILNYMKKYELNRLNVIASNMDDLIARGLVDKNSELNINGIKGVYLYISSIDVMKNGDAVVVGSWFSSPSSAGDLKLVLRNNNGTWRIK